MALRQHGSPAMPRSIVSPGSASRATVRGSGLSSLTSAAAQGGIDIARHPALQHRSNAHNEGITMIAAPHRWRDHRRK